MISETLSKKYADTMTKEDANYLVFSLLGTEKLAEIARRCGLTRRTLYKLRERKYIQSRTKRRILKASMEVSPNETFGFLVKRSKDKAASILIIYLSHLYSEAMQKTNAEEFENTLSNFVEARTKHFGLISDELESEVNTMLRYLEESALKLGIQLPPEPLHTTKQEHLLRTFPFLVNSLYLGEEPPRNLAKMYNIPLEWTQAISSAIGSIAFSKIRVQEMEGPRLPLVAGAFAHVGFEVKRTPTSYQKLPVAAS